MSDPIDETFAEVRAMIDALHVMHPERSDKEIALALLRLANKTQGQQSRLTGLVGTVLHYTATREGERRG